MKVKRPPEVRPGRVVLPVLAVDPENKRTTGVYGSAWLARSNLIVTCSHCLPELPQGQLLAVAKKNATGAYDHYLLEDIERDRRGFDLATARVDLSSDEDWTLYSGVAQMGMTVWAYGYPLSHPRADEAGRVGFHIYPRYLEGYVTRRFLGFPATFPKAELDMPCPPGLSGAPLVLSHLNLVVGLVFGRTTIKVPDEDPAPLYHFGQAFDRETLDELSGPATGGRPLWEVLGEKQKATTNGQADKGVMPDR
jgi:hypothetical protein